MSNQPITIEYACQRCDAQFSVTAYPIIPATRDSPEEGGDIEPAFCFCGDPVDRDEVCQAAADKLDGLLSEKYEQ